METEKSVIKKTKTMTPKEKAKELIEKFSSVNIKDVEYPASELATLKRRAAKQCALIVVEEAKTACTYGEAPTWVPEEQGFEFWNEVKQEIEKL
jgi:hypothetical protein